MKRIEGLAFPRLMELGLYLYLRMAVAPRKFDSAPIIKFLFRLATKERASLSFHPQLARPSALFPRCLGRPGGMHGVRSTLEPPFFRYL
jgi:hypothetical protein